MTSLTCPSCQHEILINVVGAPPKQSNPAGALNKKAMRSVLEFMRDLGEGRFLSGELYERYMSHPKVQSGEWVSITAQTLYLALKANGAERWRDAVRRGYDLPALEGDVKPASPPPTVAAEEERRAFVDTVAAHQAQPGIIHTGMPLEME